MLKYKGIHDRNLDLKSMDYTWAMSRSTFHSDRHTNYSITEMFPSMNAYSKFLNIMNRDLGRPTRC